MPMTTTLHTLFRCCVVLDWVCAPNIPLYLIEMYWKYGECICEAWNIHKRKATFSIYIYECLIGSAYLVRRHSDASLMLFLGRYIWEKVFAGMPHYNTSFLWWTMEVKGGQKIECEHRHWRNMCIWPLFGWVRCRRRRRLLKLINCVTRSSGIYMWHCSLMPNSACLDAARLRYSHQTRSYINVCRYAWKQP